ncbi:hypothetical protein EJ08DRAFT_135164 [Tothia fuscella]|uniref:Uncharacterized protein n=1 Tax=Tothia fuscella TaxID=1048955 RepID=A0A9P4NUH5_9PEZI|nr:hypothetical protein EJ08DRAFT_135164 [Tothia fuscella]
MYNSSLNMEDDHCVNCALAVPKIDKVMARLNGWQAADVDLQYGIAIQQRNNIDCGVLSMYHATQMLSGEDIDMNVNIDLLRAEIVTRLYKTLAEMASDKIHAAMDARFDSLVHSSIELQQGHGGNNDGEIRGEGNEGVVENDQFWAVDQFDFWGKLNTADDIDLEPANFYIVTSRDSVPTINPAETWDQSISNLSKVFVEYWRIHGQKDPIPERLQLPSPLDDEGEQANLENLAADAAARLQDDTSRYPKVLYYHMAPQTSSNSPWSDNYRAPNGRGLRQQPFRQLWLRRVLALLPAHFRVHIICVGFDGFFTHKDTWLSTIRLFRLYWRITFVVPQSYLDKSYVIDRNFAKRGDLAWGYCSIDALARLQKVTQAEQTSQEDHRRLDDSDKEKKKHFEILAMLAEIDEWKQSKRPGYKGPPIDKPLYLGYRNGLAEGLESQPRECENCASSTSTTRWYRGTALSSIRCDNCRALNLMHSFPPLRAQPARAQPARAQPARAQPAFRGVLPTICSGPGKTGNGCDQYSTTGNLCVLCSIDHETCPGAGRDNQGCKVSVRKFDDLCNLCSTWERKCPGPGPDGKGCAVLYNILSNGETPECGNCGRAAKCTGCGVYASRPYSKPERCITCRLGDNKCKGPGDDGTGCLRRKNNSISRDYYKFCTFGLCGGPGNHDGRRCGRAASKGKSHLCDKCFTGYHERLEILRSIR